MSLIRSLSRYSPQARRGLSWTYVMSIISFRNRSLGVKIGEFCYHMLIRRLPFQFRCQVWVSPYRYFSGSPILSGFLLDFFWYRSVFLFCITSVRSKLSPIRLHQVSQTTRFGGLTGLKLLCSSTLGAEKEIHCLWPRKIHCLCNHP